MFQTLFGRLLNHLYHNVNEKVSVKPLSLICITSILTTIHSLKNCSVFGRLNRSGSFAKNLVKFKGKNKNVIHQPSAGRYSRPRAQFSQYGPPSWRITYIYYISQLVRPL